MEHIDTRSWGDLVRVRAVMALGHTRDPAVFETLVEKSRVDNADPVRSAAAVALGVLADHVPDYRDRCVQRLCHMLREPGFRAQLAAIGALATAGSSAAVGPLSQVHASAPDGRTRRKAWEALHQLRQGRTTEDGLQRIRDELSTLREQQAGLRARVDRLQR